MTIVNVVRIGGMPKRTCIEEIERTLESIT